MKKYEFFITSKNLVKEYVNRNIPNNKLLQRDIKIMKFEDTSDEYRALLTIDISDESYYEVIYNKHTKHLDSRIYKKDSL